MTSSFRFQFQIFVCLVFCRAFADALFDKARPVLAEKCFSCHSHAANKSKGGLVLDSREAMLHGGDSGPALVPGKPDESLLIKAVRYTDENLQMPPKGKLQRCRNRRADRLGKSAARLGPAAKKMATARPNECAAKSATKTASGGRFNPLKTCAPPKVAGGKNEIDSFILARLEKEGLKTRARSLEKRARFVA